MSCHAFARIWNEMNGNKMGKFRIHFDNLAVAVDDVECRVCVLQILIRPDNELQYTRWRFIAIVVCCAKTVHIANQAWGERQCVCVCERVDDWPVWLCGRWEQAECLSLTEASSQHASQHSVLSPRSRMLATPHSTLALSSLNRHTGQHHRGSRSPLQLELRPMPVKKGLDVKTGSRTSEA